MNNLLNKTHVYDAVKALDLNVKISKWWFASLDDHVRRVIAANVSANRAAGRTILKSFAAATAKQTAGEETSMEVAKSTGEPKYTMAACGIKFKLATALYTADVDAKPATDDSKSKLRQCRIYGELRVRTGETGQKLSTMLEKLARRQLNTAGIRGVGSVKIVEVKHG